MDKQDSIAKLNRFPLESNLHTFLLDKNNRVIAVGNPVYNPKIKKLYFNIISGKKPFYRVMQNKEQMLVWINDF